MARGKPTIYRVFALTQRPNAPEVRTECGICLSATGELADANIHLYRFPSRYSGRLAFIERRQTRAPQKQKR